VTSSGFRSDNDALHDDDSDVDGERGDNGTLVHTFGHNKHGRLGEQKNRHL
jgi:hypothetical protein